MARRISRRLPCPGASSSAESWYNRIERLEPGQSEGLRGHTLRLVKARRETLRPPSLGFWLERSLSAAHAVLPLLPYRVQRPDAKLAQFLRHVAPVARGLHFWCIKIAEDADAMILEVDDESVCAVFKLLAVWSEHGPSPLVVADRYCDVACEVPVHKLVVDGRDLRPRAERLRRRSTV